MKIDNYYKKLYNDSQVEEYSDKSSEQMLRKIEKFIKGKENILEAGCGNGKLAALLKTKTKGEVVGAEISESGLKISKKLGVKTVKADLLKKLPFKDSEFDIIFSGQVIEHLVDPDFFLDECWRVLKKRGLLILTTPNLAAWFNRIIFLFGVQPFFMETSTIDKTIGLSFTKKLTKERQVVGHVRVFTPGALKDILKLHHFVIQVHEGYSGEFFPTPMQLVDTNLSKISSLASNTFIVARKDEY